MPYQKQYVVLRNFKYKRKTYKKYQMVWFEPDVAQILVAQHQITPYSTAINDGFWPPPSNVKVESVPKEESLTNKEPESESEPEPETEDTKSEPKVLIGNKLRAAVQKKKEEDDQSPPTTTKTKSAKKVSADKLAAIKSGGKK